MTESSRFAFQRFPDFGQELRRPFEVHEICYDCAEFYGPGHGERGCDAWPADKPMKTADRKHLLCLDFNRLPDVMPGEPTGQIFPPSRMNGRRTPRELPAKTVEPKSLSPAQTKPTKTRHCPCGADLAKGKQFCDGCRTEHRRQTSRQYMRRHRVEPLADMPQERRGMPLAHAGATKHPKSDP